MDFMDVETERTEVEGKVMPSLWPNSFDEEGNKTGWKYRITEEHYSPATKDFMYVAGDEPPIEDQVKWMEEHPDSILTYLKPTSPAREP
jgi:hypothetical protein